MLLKQSKEFFGFDWNTAMAREIMGEGNGDGGELKAQRTRDIETKIP